MHRWFFANDEILCPSPTSPSICETQISATSLISVTAESNWSFKVKFDWQLCRNEFLAISGSCPILGNWNVQSSLPLKRDDETSLWTLTVVLPRTCDIRYRYLVYALDQKGRKVVRFWETHFGGRLISHDQFEINNTKEHEIFGVLSNEVKIERGWLRPFVTVVQFKFFNDSFVLNLGGEKIRLQIKITPIKLKVLEKCEKPLDPLLKPGYTEPCDNLNNDKEEKQNGENFAFCEVASLQHQNGEFRKQAKYGSPCGPDHLLIFNLTANVLEQCAFLIDLYNFPVKCAPDVPPNHFGYQYVMPQDLENSQGTLELAIMCATRHRPIGSLKCDYLIVKPMKPSHNFNLEKSYQKYWNTKHQGLYCGHRGCGRSFWWQNNILRENCLKSFNVAIEHGADMIEFGIQLTKDLVPIIHHDSHLYVSQNFDINLRENDIIHLPLTQQEIDILKSSKVKIDKNVSMFPLGKFTQEQLTRVKVYEPNQAETSKSTCSWNTQINRPFLTLQQALKEIKVKTGFVIDIKWPQKFADGGGKQKTLATDFDKNEYIDVILSEVFKNAGLRRIIFCSRDTDICTMVRLKQNLYPIMFLCKDSGAKINMDPCHKSISTAVCFAHAMELWGISINCVDILKVPGEISGLHKRGLRVFSWGLETRNEGQRKYLKTLGVDGIICERLNHVLKPLVLRKTFVYIVPFKTRMEIK